MGLIWKDDGIAGDGNTLESLYPFRVDLNTGYTNIQYPGGK